MKQIFPTLIFLCISISSKAQDKYKTDIDFGGGSTFTTFFELNKDQNNFTFTSPKNADKRAIGGFKTTLGRASGKLPAKGIFATISGVQKGDSLVGNAKIAVLGNLKFKGVLKGNELIGELLKENNENIGTIKGLKTNQTKIDYQNLYPKIIEITHNNIYSKEVLQTKEWQECKNKIEKLCENAQDDIELFIGFNLLSPNLPFSHYNLMVQQKQEIKEEENGDHSNVIFEEKTPETAYLKISNFSSSQKEIAQIFPKITENSHYKNLIVDLRGNAGGGLEAALEFGKHILDKETEVGYFITNKFQNSDKNRNFSELPITNAKTTDGFIDELKKGKGAKMIIPKSADAIFGGKLYILTDNKTASTCEPIVYVLKKTNRATIIGENTAGAMLSAAPFEISGKYTLFLPIADFYTYDNIRLDKVGVSPNIETEPEKALEKTLELIKG